MLNISVRSRLIALVLGMAALLLLVGGLGFHASSSAVNELKEIYPGFFTKQGESRLTH